MLVSLSEVKSYCKVDNLEISISDITTDLNFKYDGGDTTTISLTPNRYLVETLAASIQALLRTELSDSSITTTWNDSDNKFEIATNSSKTIQYINANSTAGIYIGFTQDSSTGTAIESDSVIIDDTSLLDNFRSQVDKFVKNYTRRNLEAKDYAGLYSFDSNILSLDDYPLNSISEFTTNIQPAIYLTCTSNFITLKYDGTTFTFSDGNTIAKSGLTTISDLVDAINALGNNVTASSTNDDYNSLSIDRILKFNIVTVNGYNIDFYSYNISKYDTIESNGTLYISQSEGIAYISFNAGYTSIPDDIKLSVLMIIKSMYERWCENAEDQYKYRINDIYKFYDQIPDKAKMILDLYKRHLC